MTEEERDHPFETLESAHGFVRLLRLNDLRSLRRLLLGERERPRVSADR